MIVRYKSDTMTLGAPPHVHVDHGGATCKIWLYPESMASNAGFRTREIGDILRLVRARQKELLEAWHGFFESSGDR